MTKEQLFEVMGEAEDVYIRHAAEEKKHKSAWVKWAALAACVALVVGTVLWQALPTGPEVKDPAPHVEWEGRTYIVSGSAPHSSILPEEYAYAGMVDIDGEEDCEIYVDPDNFLWVYVRQRRYSYNSTGEPLWTYQRYVDEDLRGKHFVRYNGQLYIRLIHARTYGEPPYDVDKALCEQVERTYGVSAEGALPAGFVSVGEPVFTGYDTLPEVELGTNEKVGGIFANPDVPEIILTPLGQSYLVMIRYSGPLA